MNSKENLRTLPEEEIQKIRDSVARTDTPLAIAFHGFIRRVEKQSHIHRPDSIKIKNNGHSRRADSPQTTIISSVA